MRKVGIVGFGAFGRLLVDIMAPHAEIQVFDARPIKDLPSGVSAVGIEQIASSDMVIIATELESISSVCQQLAPFVQPETLVIDICSVKEKPQEILGRQLGDRCRILATHPLFGPQSVANNGGTKGLQMVICEADLQSFPEITALFAEQLGIELLSMPADKHDKEMAWVQGLTFFVGRGLVDSQIPKLRLATGYFDHLVRLRDLELQHSKELFHTIERGNRYAKEVRSIFRNALTKLENEISEETHHE